MNICCKLLFLSVVLFGTGCASTTRFAHVPKTDASTPGHPPIIDLGNGQFKQEGIASYYADKYHGRKTANGETFNMHDITAAHPSLPFGTKLKVTNLDNGKTITVRINDRGPFAKNRIIDLSLGAAKEIDMVKTGTANVRLEGKIP